MLVEEEKCMSKLIEESLQSYKIIVVEDDKGLNRLISKNLNKEGFKTESALSGEEALSKITGDDSEIMLIDYKLSDMTARELIVELNQKDIDIPFIVMTGRGDEKIAVEMMKLGARDYIIKQDKLIELLLHSLKKICTEINNNKKLAEVTKNLHESESLRSALFNNSTDPISVTDLKNNILDLNPAFEKMFGYTRDELQGKKFPGHKGIDEGKFEDWLKSCHNGNGITGYETQRRTKTGQNIPVSISISPVKDQNNDLKALSFTYRNINKRKKAEKELKESEKRVRAKLDAILTPEGDLGELQLEDIIDKSAIQSLMDYFYELMNIGVAVVDLEGKVLIKEGWQDICINFHRQHPVTRKNCIESDTILSKGVKPGEFKAYKCKNNMWDIVTPIYIADQHMGNIFLGQFLYEDEEPDYETFRKMAQKYGFDEEAYIAALDRVPRWNKGTVNNVMQFYAKLANLLAKQSFSNLKLARTIEKQKRIEKKLQKSEEKFRLTFKTSPDSINLNRLEDGVYIDINNGFTEIMGYKPEDVIGKSSLELNIWRNEEDRKRLVKGLKERGYISNLEAEFVAKNGNIKNGLMSARIIDLAGEKVILSITRDITERKRREKEYKQLIDGMNETVFVIDFDGHFIDVNKTAVKVLGYTREELLNMTPTDIDPHHNRKMIEEIVNLLKQKKSHQFETQHQTNDGELIPVDISLSIVRYKGKDAILNISRDISDKKRAEKEREQLKDQLRQAQKLESIGTLAGGVAHDFNNILTVIIGLAQLVLSRTKKSDPNYSNLEGILNSAERAADLTKQLLLFSRKEEVELKIIDLNETISNLRKMLKRLIGENIKIHNNFNHNIGKIEADKNQIEQVLTNLVVNAKDAMPEGGDLTISTEKVHLDGVEAKNFPNVKPGNYICLSVEDTGCGMKPDIEKKIFDPFFTTKGRAEGTGMGLSVVHGIVKKHKGFIDVQSEPGKGTTFKIYFPIVEDELKHEEKQKEVSFKDYQGQGETILVVEDEESFLDYLENILTTYGYKLYCTNHGADALEIYQNEYENIDLVLSDVIMPDMNGKELIERIKAINNNVKVVLSSGYPDNKINLEEIKKKGYNFINKPYGVLKILKLLRKELE